jgi:hypothetical protein
MQDISEISKNPGADNLFIVLWALVKATLSMLLVVGAIYSLVNVYPGLTTKEFILVLIFCTSTCISFCILLTREYKINKETLLDETILEIDAFWLYIVSILIGLCTDLASAFLPVVIFPFLLWLGPISVITIVATIYLIGGYYKNPYYRVGLGTLIGIAISIVIKVIGVLAAILVDSYGVVFITLSCITEIVFFAWYLYNDIKYQIAINKDVEEREKARKEKETARE